MILIAQIIYKMRQMFKGIAEGMLGMSCAIMCAPMLVKLMVTANDIINPMESIFKEKKD